MTSPYSPTNLEGVKHAKPTLTAGATAQIGTGGTVSLSATSDDDRGTVTLVTGTGSLAAGTLFTVSFNEPKDANRLPVIVLDSANAAATGIDVGTGTVTSAGFTVIDNTRVVAASTTYEFNYIVTD
jgi:hypothetical protein